MGAEAMSSHGSRVGGGGGALSRQGSVCSLTFSEVEGQLHGDNLDDLLRSGRKTADEVWRDIQGAAAACPRAQMTLEDFLSRGGGPPADAAADTDTGSGACGWAQQLYQPAPAPAAQLELGRHRPAVVGRPVPRPLGAGAGPVLDALYHDGQEGGAGAKRAAGEGGVAERCNERRKKRMIKNRESAARSRARKQAYTNELENKISQLEEENERLRRHKAPEPVVQYVPRQELKNQLRRANSANF
ncbi:ABSCISIC ACID-INSENSITIVE 5-like protein 2 [Miscanthus floridulus]|uniref:ABSCISIC ACID-INSENSITIVE 5-like protein 2 n=1 Tax=Miscanthus floridulus TaxID=154761 RepID=UPI00345B29A2